MILTTSCDHDSYTDCKNKHNFWYHHGFLYLWKGKRNKGNKGVNEEEKETTRKVKLILLPLIVKHYFKLLFISILNSSENKMIWVVGTDKSRRKIIWYKHRVSLPRECKVDIDILRGRTVYLHFAFTTIETTDIGQNAEI
jgi:hypothetical protein